MIWNIIVPCICGAVIAELAYRLVKKNRENEGNKSRVREKMCVIQRMDIRIAELENENEELRKQLRHDVTMPVIYRTENYHMQTLKYGVHVDQWRLEQGVYECEIQEAKDRVRSSLATEAVKYAKIIAAAEPGGVEIKGMLIVGVPEGAE